ncbi:hypothetical protein EMIT0158MI4_140191 [Burkholderia ambifaria]
MRSSGPMPDARPADGGSEWTVAVEFMVKMIGNPARAGHYLTGKHSGTACVAGSASSTGCRPGLPSAPASRPLTHGDAALP